MNENLIINVQRYYRVNKILKLIKNILIIYDLNNTENKTFYQFTLTLKKKRFEN